MHVEGRTMRRAVLMVVPMIGLFSTAAMADDFIFSFPGVTGEIFGLTNNTTSSATKVLLTTYPPILGTIPVLDVTAWPRVDRNSFIEQDGQIVYASFGASDAHSYEFFFGDAFGDPQIAGLFLDKIAGTSGFNTFTPAIVPEPSSWIYLLTVMLAVTILLIKRNAQGLAVRPPE
jgi:hypothetical protein